MSKATFPETTGQESLKPQDGGTRIASDMRNALSALFQGDHSPLRPRSQAAPNMTVAVSPALINSYFSQVWLGTTAPLNYAGGNSPAVTAPTTNPRIDLLTIDASGTLAWTVGVEAASPSAPNCPSGKVPICYIYCKTTMTKIVNFEDKDANPNDGYIYKDVRPFMNLGGSDEKVAMKSGDTPDYLSNLLKDVNPVNLLWNGDFESWNGLALETLYINQIGTDYGANIAFAYPGFDACSQSFKVASSGFATRASFRLKKASTGTINGTARAYIYPDNGAHKPDTSVAPLSTSVTILDCTTLTSSYVTYDFVFTRDYLLSTGVEYHFVVVYTGNYSGVDYVHISTPNGDIYSDGRANQRGNGIWSNLGGGDNPADFNFRIYLTSTDNAPDGWSLNSGILTRESTIVKLGIYSVKLATSVSAIGLLYVDAVHTSKGLNYWRGRAATFSCWVYASTANRVRLSIWDGAYTYSSYHTGDSTWQLLTVTRTIDSGSVDIQLRLEIDSGSAISAHFDGAMFVEGASAFAFSPKPAEEGVWSDISLLCSTNGWSSPTVKVFAKRIGKTAFVTFEVTGTANAADTQIYLPVEWYIKSGSIAYVSMGFAYNGSEGYILMQIYKHPTWPSSCMLRKIDQNNLVSSGTKSVYGSIFYELN